MLTLIPELGATTRAALERLLAAADGDTAQARHVADFLLAWWAPDLYGGFALTALWEIDDELARACVLVFAWVAANRVHPDVIGYGAQFEALFEQVGSTTAGEWRQLAS